MKLIQALIKLIDQAQKSGTEEQKRATIDFVRGVMGGIGHSSHS